MSKQDIKKDSWISEVSNILVGFVNKTGAEEVIIDVEGLTYKDKEIGDWEIIIRKKKKSFLSKIKL